MGGYFGRNIQWLMYIGFFAISRPQELIHTAYPITTERWLLKLRFVCRFTEAKITFTVPASVVNIYDGLPRIEQD